MTEIGIVGIGSWGQNLVSTFDELATVGRCCHTGNEEAAAWLAAEYPDVERTTDLDDLLEDPALDAIVVATPIPTLAEIAEASLRAGKHVFVEKPMANTVEEAAQLSALAGRRSELVFVGYIFVHHPFFAAASELAANADVNRLELDWRTLGSFPPDLVRNLVCHPVSVVLSRFGPPADITVGDTLALTGDLDAVELRFDYHTFECSITVDRVSPIKQYRYGVYAADGRARVATDEACHHFDPDTLAFDVDDEMTADPLTTECQRFLDAIEGTVEPITDAAFGNAVFEVLREIETEL